MRLMEFPGCEARWLRRRRESGGSGTRIKKASSIFEGVTALDWGMRSMVHHQRGWER